MSTARTWIWAATAAASMTGASVAQPPATGAAPQPPPARADEGLPDSTQLRKSIVKIFTTSRNPDLARPWTKQQPSESTGSGVVIDGKRILTNNHVVSYASQVLVQPDGSSDKLPARVIATAPGIDLAVITTDDASFFDEHPPMAISDDLPDVGATAVAYGYPIGGDALSITKGIVSRVEYTQYDEGTMGLRIQVDTALNPGNSGGPACNMDAKLVGLVFSGIETAQNIGYLIPVEEIRAFLGDIEDGKVDGRPQMFADLQTLENQALRDKLKVTRSQTGIVVTKPESDKPEYPLKKWDIISAIGDMDVDNAGMVTVRPNLRLEFNYYVPKLAKAGTVPLTIIRDGKEQRVDVPVKHTRDLVFPALNNTYPSYFILGPMTFSGAVQEHAGFALRRSALFVPRKSPLISRLGDAVAFEGEQVVVGPFNLFPHKIAKGYEVRGFPVLIAVNGVKIKSLRHLIQVVRDSTDEYLTFEWDEGTESVVFKREDLVKSTGEILDDNGIRYPMSEDVRDLWPAK